MSAVGVGGVGRYASGGFREAAGVNQRINGRHLCCRTPAERRPHLVNWFSPAPLAQWQSSGL